MKRMLIIFSLCVIGKLYAWPMNNIWETRDQQAQRLMSQGKYSQAQQAFQTPQWKAAAAMRAKDYEHARLIYQSLQDEESHYNLGNALAHLGHYKDAIAAYNKVLALNPKHEDAAFNRKMLEDLLKNQNKENQDKKDQGKQDQAKQDQGKQDQAKQDQDKQDQAKQDQDKQDQGKQDQGKQDQGKQDQGKQDQGKQDQGKQDQGKQDQGKQDQNNSNEKPQNQSNKDKPLDTKQAKVGLDKKQQSTAQKEQQAAKEQWLKLIPDDPGGLMREKFRRDYLQRHNGWNQ